MFHAIHTSESRFQYEALQMGGEGWPQPNCGLTNWRLVH
jgi:hypothetical protein